MTATGLEPLLQQIATTHVNGGYVLGRYVLTDTANAEVAVLCITDED